jgi:hypothetical protein
LQIQVGGIALQPKGGLGSAGGLPQPAAKAGAERKVMTDRKTKIRMIARLLSSGYYLNAL